MRVKINRRAEYKLYVDKTVAKNIKMSPTMKKLIVSLAMQSFDDGLLFAKGQLRLAVDVD